jgi:cytoskeleton protein RodZ
MDDSNDSRSARAAETEGVGVFLRKRRESLGLSYSDVASVVKLPAKRIEALEAERWAELPDGPFLRGFLRNIARALDLDAGLLMARVDDSLMRARNPESILVMPGSTRALLPRRSGPLEDRHGGRMLVYGAFLFAVVAALIAWSGTESFDRTLATGRGLLRPSTPAIDSAALAKADTAPATTDALTAANPAEALPSAAPAPTNADSPSAALTSASTSSAVPAVPSSPLALLFHFNEECWVEVRDAEGKVLMKSLNAAGSERAIEGEMPYSLVVGNAKGVDLHFRGQPVDLGP